MSEKDLECEYNMQLNSLDEIIEFVIEMDKCKDSLYAIGENAYADAKSILGMFSIDTSRPLTVEFYGDVPREVQKGMKRFIID